MKYQDLLAIDVHTHAEISCRQPDDDYAQEIEEQKKKYFKSGTPPTILETVDFYRKQKIGLVMFTVDTEFEIGRRQVKKLIADGISGFKFHPTCQGFFPNDRMAYPMYEAMAEAKMPVIFH